MPGILAPIANHHWNDAHFAVEFDLSGGKFRMPKQLLQQLSSGGDLIAVAAMAAGLIVSATCLAPANAQTVSTNATLSSVNMDYLDGKKFKAGIVQEQNDGAQKNRFEDFLTFKDGKFSSEVCRKYNFSDAPYWIRAEGDQIHFLAELESPTDGRMVWKGTIKDGQLRGTMHWTKKRWYWTIDTEHEIHGELRDN